MDAIGSGGVQLFVDAGQPVNSDLVAALVREVLEEDIAKMLGQHQRNISRDGNQLRSVDQESQHLQEEVCGSRNVIAQQTLRIHVKV